MSVATRCVNGVCSCLLPLDRNDFRPLALRHKPLAVVSALLVAVKALALVAVALTPTTAELSTITTARIVQLTNAERVKAGLSPLAVSPALSQAAQGKGAHMLDEDYFAHISPSGVTPWFWMKKHGYAYQVAGENLAIDFIEAEDVVAAWLASPSHRENMLHSAYTETGVAVVTGEFQGGTSTVVVHMFGLPAGGSAQVSAPTATPTPQPTTAGTQAEQPSPTPTPLPATPAPDTTPPRTPRIAAAEGVTAVQDTVILQIEGEAGSQILFKINGITTEQSVTLTDDESTVTLALRHVPDGEVVIQALATDTARNVSGLSEVVTLTKDTEEPALARETIRLLLSPVTDQPRALLDVTADTTARIDVAAAQDSSSYAADEPILVSPLAAALKVSVRDAAGNVSAAYDVTVAPQYAADDDQQFTNPPSRLSRAARWIAGSVFVMILLLLSLAIFIQVRVQRPALITHASFVLLLALVFLFV